MDMVLAATSIVSLCHLDLLLEANGWSTLALARLLLLPLVDRFLKGGGLLMGPE